MQPIGKKLNNKSLQLVYMSREDLGVARQEKIINNFVTVVVYEASMNRERCCGSCS